jgi:hypothetical protein
MSSKVIVPAAMKSEEKTRTKKPDAFQHSKPFEFPARNAGKNPKGIMLRAEPTGDPGNYQEIAFRAFRKAKATADFLVGLDQGGNLRVLITADGDGDGDHAIAVYPEKPFGNGYVEEPNASAQSRS